MKRFGMTGIMSETVLKRFVMLRQLAVWLGAVVVDVSANKPGLEDIHPSQELSPPLTPAGGDGGPRS